MPIELKDMPEPIGNFILEQEDVKPLMMPDGAYYHYSHVCVMLKKILTSRFATQPPTTEQTELWKEVSQDLFKQGLFNIQCFPETTIKGLSEKYTLTRKEEVPEAVEFGQWLREQRADIFYGSPTTDALYKEFQLFKKGST